MVRFLRFFGPVFRWRRRPTVGKEKLKIEDANQVIINNFEQVLNLVLNSFHHPHPRVGWATINSIGQLSTELGPDLQAQYHQRVLLALVAAMNNSQTPRVQAMEVRMSLQGSQMETDDPTTSYMLQAWARLCKCLGQDFLSYMRLVMPPLLQSAQLKPDVIIASADSNDAIDESDDESMETITLGDKRIGIKTSVLEEKATACNMLCCYADELKEGFYPSIDQVAPLLVPLLKFYFHEEARKAAVSVHCLLIATPELLRFAKLAVEKGIAQGRNEAYVKQLCDYIVPALVEALHKEPDTEICSNMLDALNEYVQISEQLLDESQVRSIVDEIKQVITASSSRKKERAERAKAEDFDAEDGELLREENEQEEEVFDQISELLGTLIKTFKASFLPLFDELSSYLMPMWGKDKTAEERRIAICIFDDVAEQCREAALKYYDTHLPFVLEACNDESPDVRQAAVYGLGVCAEFGGSIFKPLVGEALSRLNVVIRHPNASQPENVMAYDNAVSALGKICQFHRDSIDSAQVVLSRQIAEIAIEKLRQSTRKPSSYTFALQWRDSFARIENCCHALPREQMFTIHFFGAAHYHPLRNGTNEAFEWEEVKGLSKDMIKYWPNLFHYRSEESGKAFWKKQWLKGVQFGLSQIEYFALAIEIMKALHNLGPNLGIPLNEELTVADVGSLVSEKLKNMRVGHKLKGRKVSAEVHCAYDGTEWLIKEIRLQFDRNLYGPINSRKYFSVANPNKAVDPNNITVKLPSNLSTYS